jgi:hypothetical protein
MLSLDSQKYTRISLSELQYTETDDYFKIESANAFGTIEILVFKSETRKMEFEVRNRVNVMYATLDHRS